VEGVVVHRPGPARPGPLVVDLHGGPAWVWTQTFQTGLFASAQLFAADGYTVFLPNPRGSHGYGDAAQRMADWGQLDYQDIQSGVDTLIRRGLAHPDSLAIMGWSYGGFMSAWTITQTPRFRAAVVGAGITEPVAMWGTQNVVHYYEAFFGGSPFAEGAWDAYQRTSALSGVGRVRTPTLVIHGMQDPIVPPNQGLIFYRALRSNGVAAELVWLPRTEHGPTEPGLMYETVRRTKEWIDRWVRGIVPAPATALQP
jgi:dipeptidyl aminopeptidase/acylaminoacyl peptidase